MTPAEKYNDALNDYHDFKNALVKLEVLCDKHGLPHTDIDQELLDKVLMQNLVGAALNKDTMTGNPEECDHPHQPGQKDTCDRHRKVRSDSGAVWRVPLPGEEPFAHSEKGHSTSYDFCHGYMEKKAKPRKEYKHPAGDKYEHKDFWGYE